MKKNSSSASKKQARVTLSRDLRLMDITMIGVGAMIGAGIFVLTGIAAGAAGPALILSFALNGIITIFTAMVYAELGSAIPEAGGGYLWVKEGLPGPNAFLGGWMSWFAHAVAGSLYALGFGSYVALVLSELHLTIPGLEGELLHKILAVVIIAAFVYINFRGASETGAAGNVVTILKIVILAVFIGAGIWAIADHPIYLDKFQNFAPKGITGILSAMGLTFIAFEGYEIIVQAGEEVKNPRRNVPKAVFLSLAIVIPIYMLIAFVAIGAVNPDTDIPTYQWLAKYAELGIAEAARQFMPFGTLLLLVGGILSTMSALNATTYSSTRVSFAMGRDKNLPDAFAQVHSQRRTPYKALALSGILIGFMAVAVPIEDVAAAADIMFLLLFLQVNFAVITIRKKYGKRLRYGYLMPFFPIIPIIAIVANLFLAVFMFHFSPMAWYLALSWIVVGALIYYMYARNREQVKSGSLVMLEQKSTLEPEEERFHIVVPIANPASLPILLPPAIQAARRHGGIITLLHVVKVPRQLPISAGRAYIEKNKSLTDKALDIIEGEEVAAEVLIRVSHRPAQAIAETALERNANLLILGWRGGSREAHTLIGQNIDRLVKEVNCDVLVVQQNDTPPFKKILIPIAEPSQTTGALEMAEILGNAKNCRIDLMHSFPEDTTSSDQEKLMQEIQEQVDEFQSQNGRSAFKIQLQPVVSRSFLRAVVQENEKYDCILLGARRVSWFRRKFFRYRPSRIARIVKPPVVLYRAKTTALSFGIHKILNFFRGGYSEIDPSSEKQLQEQGLLRPESQKTKASPSTSVNTPGLLLTGILAFAGAVIMYLGDGSLYTWIGAAGFLLALTLFIWVSILGIKSR
jgi:amino acid transporter/nucleotide-binding universal stress UspA family protein